MILVVHVNTECPCCVDGRRERDGPRAPPSAKSGLDGELAWVQAENLRLHPENVMESLDVFGNRFDCDGSGKMAGNVIQYKRPAV